MKKKLLLILAVVFALVVMAACNNRTEPTITTPSTTPSTEVDITADDTELVGGEVNIATLRGPSGLSMLLLMDTDTQNDYNVMLMGAPTEIPPLLVRGDIDIAAVPTNLASNLYNTMDGNIVVLAATTLGVLHIVDTTGTINSVEDLRGQTIYASGGGGMPEFILNYILEGNGLTPGVDVIIEFRTEHTEIAGLIDTGIAQIAMLPEPFATTTVNRVDGLEYALDLTEEWNKISPDAGLIMTTVIARREFVEQNPDLVEIFMMELESSVNFTNNSVEQAAELAVTYDIIPAAPVARLAIPRSNIVFITGGQFETYVTNILEVFYNHNPVSIGGQMPNADFFFNN
ncbi:MAG: ABC transporter substrate-binding protein [Defluviitaleaceae bacterium]|nr:ABC transporter substrate-binding protein [Defluviitaleaceae bacterium]